MFIQWAASTAYVVAGSSPASRIGASAPDVAIIGIGRSSAMSVPPLPGRQERHRVRLSAEQQRNRGSASPVHHRPPSGQLHCCLLRRPRWPPAKYDVKRVKVAVKHLYG